MGQRVTDTKTSFIEIDDERELSLPEGVLQKGMKPIEDALGVTLSVRGNRIIIQGDEDSVSRAETVINEIRELKKEGRALGSEDVGFALRAMARDGADSLVSLLDASISVSPKKKPVMPRTRVQAEYVNAIKKYDIAFGIGPAGTGKTYLAMAMAVNALLKKRVSRIVLARPAVEAGERLGFLPGDIREKVDPYLRPLYDALYSMMDVERAGRLIEQGVIEIAPLAFMRGRTLNDAFVILDEAQNTTSEQMKMYLTRLGYNSRTVITGDTTQIDLPPGKVSGLVEAEKILGDIKGIKIVYFSEKDVVRHRLVQKIVKAYEKREREKTEKAQD